MILKIIEYMTYLVDACLFQFKLLITKTNSSKAV